MNHFDGLFYALDPDNLQLISFDLDSEKVFSKVVFDKEGPDQLSSGNFLSFNFIGRDSILFLNDVGNLYIFNNAGEKLYGAFIDGKYLSHVNYNTNNLNLFNLGVPYFLHFPLVVDSISNHFFILCKWTSNAYEGENIWNEYKNPVMVQIDPFLKKKPIFFGRYPFDISNNLLPASIYPHFEYGINSEKIIVYDHYPMINVDSGLYCVKSKFDHGRFLKVSKNGRVEVQETITRYHQDAGYKSVHYDKYRNLYYIIFKHEVRTKDPHIMEASFSIITLNEQFEVLGECEFPPDTYDFLHVHVVPAGILLLKENPYYSKNSEEFLEADIIKIDI